MAQNPKLGHFDHIWAHNTNIVYQIPHKLYIFGIYTLLWSLEIFEDLGEGSKIIFRAPGLYVILEHASGGGVVMFTSLNIFFKI